MSVLDQILNAAAAFSPWQQDALYRLLEKPNLDDTDIAALVARCEREADTAHPAGSGGPQPRTLPESVDGPEIGAESVRIRSISNVCNVNALAPKRALELEANGLNVVFGANASGKSGYVRILKSACGARASDRVLPNVFSAQGKPSAKLTYSVGSDDKKVEWRPDEGAVPDLRPVAIFDAKCGAVYIREENEIAYEPHGLRLLTALADVCDRVAQKLRSEIKDRDRDTATISLPRELQGTRAAEWYSTLSSTTTDEKINENTTFDDEKAERLAELDRLLAVPNPSEEAKRLRQEADSCARIATSLRCICGALAPKRVRTLALLRADAQAAVRTADEASRAMCEQAPLAGVGTATWIRMWEAAREYSNTAAYPGKTFPVPNEEARCVLCQQELDPTARRRMTDMEKFVQDTLRKKADQLDGQVNERVQELRSLPRPADFQHDLETVKAYKPELAQELENLVNEGQRYVEAVLRPRFESLPATDGRWIASALRDLRALRHRLIEKAQKHETAADENSRNQQSGEAIELRARKWLSENRDNLKTSVHTKRKVELLRKAERSADTTKITRLATDLSREHVTEEAIKRFTGELRLLGADSIQIEVVPSRGAKGKALHCIKLKGCEVGGVDADDVLSEGEFRIVSLAAFLAEEALSPTQSALVLDDPVSSLDLEWRENVARRLVEIAKGRQVIVFTHDLPLLVMLRDEAEKQGTPCAFKTVTRGHWGTGELGSDPPLSGRKIEDVLKGLETRVAEAESVLKSEGSQAYNEKAIAINVDFRNCIERVVEEVLLNRVVLRFRRGVTTQGRLPKLAAITAEDCGLLDELMTKYSKPEHSQPIEAPAKLPTPQKFREDIRDLGKWISEFRKRTPS